MIGVYAINSGMRVRKVWDFTIDSPMPPKKVLTGVTDFSERRPDIWPAITRNQYRVYEVSSTSAHVQEGTGPMWTEERYDWSKPGLVRSVIQRSNLFFPDGVWECRVTPGVAGGSHINVHMERDYRGLMGLLGSIYITLQGGASLFRKDFLLMLDAVNRKQDIS